MIRFTRTVAGKTALFIGCIISICVLIASVIGAFMMLGREFYTQSEKEIFDSYISNELYADGYSIVYKTLTGTISETDYSNSNLIYEMTDESGKVLSRSKEENELEVPTHIRRYGVLRSGGEITDVFYHYDFSVIDEGADYYTVRFCFKNGFPENDIYSFIYRFTHIFYCLRYAIYVIGVLAFFAAIACFITLMCVSARTPYSEELVPGPLNKVPFDLLLAVIIVSGILTAYLIYNIFYDNFLVGISSIIAGVIYFGIGIGLCMSIAARIKQHYFLKNTVIYYFLKGIIHLIKNTVKFITNIPLVWRTAIFIAAVTAIEFYAIVLTWWESDNLMVFWVLEKLILIPMVLYISIMLKKLYNSGKSLANGDIDCKVNTKNMVWDFKRHGENLNNIANGITIAVEDRLKSERLKTELITNVSHDIKTPLTSVINYANLISKQQCDNQNVKEYASVLVRQSVRLTRLIDDLVEASKASSGNLDVELIKCDAAVFLTQASGEYSEKLDKRELTLVTKQPDFPVKIMADGRRMWRIFDNLMNNICKYALSGTRVYLTLETVDKNAVITFKNTSRDALDITEDELMERFVRGDKSRNTEGNGLGLSIAKSLAELQNGKLQLEIDGDLFKATLTFPMM